MNKYHYVYRLKHKDTGEFYYGSRTCECNPKLDDYMGSMTTWKPDKSMLIKEILKDNFNSREDALKYEASLIKKDWNNDLIRNYHIPSSKQFRKVIHPFKNNKKMLEWCQKHDIKVNTPDGSDIDWNSKEINELIVYGERRNKKVEISIAKPKTYLQYP